MSTGAFVLSVIIVLAVLLVHRSMSRRTASNPERPEGSRSIGQRLVDGLRATTYLEMIAMFGIVLMLASPYFMLIVPLLLVAWLIRSHATNRIARKSQR
jgi:cobalamin synthase